MKFWYDDKKTPNWLEVLALVFIAVVLGGMVALGLLGISIGQFFAQFI